MPPPLQFLAACLLSLAPAALFAALWSLPVHEFATAEAVVRGAGDLGGKHYMVTGANSGLGFETARVLAAGGARVWMLTRTVAKCRHAQARLPKDSRQRTACIEADLASLCSVRAAASAFLLAEHEQGRHGLDAIVLSAGTLLAERTETPEGLEQVSTVNWVAQFHLAQLLRPALRRAAALRGPARVVHVSSNAHLFVHPFFGRSAHAWLDDWQFEHAPYDQLQAYSLSKFMQVAGAVEMDRRWRGEGVVSHAVHPGVVRTALAGANTHTWLSVLLYRVWPFNAWVRTVGEGAAAQVACAVDPRLSGGGGYANGGPRTFVYGELIPGLGTHDAAVGKRVWADTLAALLAVNCSVTRSDREAPRSSCPAEPRVGRPTRGPTPTPAT